MSDFESAIKQAAEKSVLKIITEGSWIATDYNSRFKIPAELMSDAYAMIDKDSLKSKLSARIEDELVDRIVNHLAAELATDIKQILSVKERREALRHVARQNIDAIMQPPTAS